MEEKQEITEPLFYGLILAGIIIPLFGIGASIYNSKFPTRKSQSKTILWSSIVAWLFWILISVK